MSIFTYLFQYEAKVEPLQPLTANFESLRHQPWSEPVRTKIAPVLAVALAASGLFFTPSAPFPETVTESRWHQPWSDPIRRKTAPVPDWYFPAQVTVSFTWSQGISWDQPVWKLKQTPDIGRQGILGPVLPPALAMTSWLQWPDFATKTKPAAEFPAFTLGFPPIQIWYPPPAWPDTATKAKPAVDFKPWSFIPAPVQVWYPPNIYPDIVPYRAKPSPEFPAFTFGFPPPQVWYPANDRWPDLAWAAKRVAQNPDWSYGTFITPSFIPTYTQWVQWPEMVRGKIPAIDTQNALAFLAIPPIATTIADWPDYISRKPAPIDTQPLAFSPQQTTVTVTWNNWSPWPDIVPAKAKPVTDFIPWQFIVSPLQVWYPPPAWPDTAPAAKRAAEFQALALMLRTPIQVWYPSDRWPDFAPRKPLATDAPSAAFVAVTTPTVVVMAWNQWPDFAPKKPVPLNYDPLAFLQTITTPVNGFNRWPDFVYKKAAPLNFDSLALVQTVTTPWNSWTQWPDFGRVIGKPGLLTGAHQFQAFWPGPTIHGTTVNVTMSAFEINTDGASVAIFVIQSKPAVKAAVSIHEIGILGGSITP